MEEPTFGAAVFGVIEATEQRPELKDSLIELITQAAGRAKNKEVETEEGATSLQHFEDMVASALCPITDFLDMYDVPEGEHEKIASACKVLTDSALKQIDKVIDALEKHAGGKIFFNVSNSDFPIFCDRINGVEVIPRSEAAKEE